MGSNYTPSDVGSGFQSKDNVNAELEKIRLDLVDKVDRNGVLPNAMAADLDIGTNQLLNVEAGVLGTDGVNLTQVQNTATSIATSIFNAGGAGQGQTTGDPITFNYGEATGSQGTLTRTQFDLNALFGVTEMLGLTVIVDGVFQAPSSYTVSDVTTVTFSESLEASTGIVFIYGDLSPTPIFSNANATLNETAVVATAGQTVFTAPTYVIGQKQLMVHIGGIMQSLALGDYTETTTTSITLDEAMAGGERVVILNITGV
jgi:hypothetical protein